MSKWLNKILAPSQLAGIEIVIQPDSTISYNSVVLKKNGGKIQLLKSQQGIPDIAQLKKIVSPTIALSISIDGKGILHKKIPYSTKDTAKVLLNKVLPNASLSDFHVFTHVINDSAAIVSIIRVSSYDEILEIFRSAKYDVVNCSLGPFSIETCLPLISSDIKSEIILNRHKLSIAGNKINEIESTETQAENSEVSIGDEQFPFTLLNAFALGFKELIKPDFFYSPISICAQLKETYKQKRTFNLIKWSAAMFFFALLWTNFFVNDHYSKEKAELESKIDLSKGAVKKMEKLKAELISKKGFLNKLGILESSKTSFYADQIAQTVPHQIGLFDLTIHPSQKNINDDKNMIFEMNKVRIKGSCNKTIELNEWIKELKSYSWIKDVNVVGFIQNKEKNIGEFHLDVSLN